MYWIEGTVFVKTIVQTVQVLPDLKLSLEMLSSNHVKMPYSVLIVITIMMLLAPMAAMPHVVEKILMLINGTLTKPIDIFDLLLHLFPLILLILKFIKDRRRAP